MIIILLCIVICIGFAIAYYGAQDPNIRRMCQQLPGPKGWPLIGNGLLFFGRSTEFIDKVKVLIHKYGTPLHLKIGHKHYVLVDSPQDMQIVMNSPNAIDKDEVYRFMILPDTTASLVMSNGELWRHHRRLLNPAFNPTILQSYVPIFNRCGRIAVESVEQAVNVGREFDIEESLHTCSLNMIVETSLGTRMNFKRDSKILVSIERFMKIVGTRMFKFWLHPNVFFRLSKLYRTFLDDSEVFLTFAQNILARIKRAGNNNDQRVASKSFINQLLKLANSEDAFSDDEVVGETVLTIIAGNETSATVMSNVVLLLAMHPEVQEKVFAELKVVFNKPDAYIGAEELAELVYLEAVIKETQRVMAVIPVITRTTTGDVELSNGVIIPKGCNIALALFSLHHRKDVWGNDADQFRPERFATDIAPYSFLPYSGGPRICIGYKYAPISMKVALTYLLRKFQFSTALKMEELQWSFGITQRLENKHLVTAKRREWGL